jgi:WD40 repeat protein
VWQLEKSVDGSIIESKIFECADAGECLCSVFVTHDRLALGATDNSLRVYRLTPRLSLEGGQIVSSGHAQGDHKEARINCVCCSPDASNLFVTGGSDDAVILWDGSASSSGRRALHALSTEATPMAMDWAATDRSSAGGGGSCIGVILKNGGITIAKVQGKALNKVASIQGKGCGSAIRFSPDAKFLVAGRRNGKVDLYAAISGAPNFELRKSFSAHSCACCALDWSSPRDEAGQGCLFFRSNAYWPTEELKVWMVAAANGKEAKQVRVARGGCRVPGAGCR